MWRLCWAMSERCDCIMTRSSSTVQYVFGSVETEMWSRRQHASIRVPLGERRCTQR